MPKKQSRTITLEELATKSTISVEQASTLIGISRQAAYDAVNRGDLPSMCIGRRKRVLALPLYRILTQQS
jgi:predicted DNA-binding transcriptional regulator AlpA